MELILFYILLFSVAFLYASVGHGGASGYLFLMALFHTAPDVMKPTALVLNVFVSLVAFIQFYRGKYFQWRLFLPLALFSVPMAFLGGQVTVSAEVYRKVLGLLLLLPVVRFLFFSQVEVTEPKEARLLPLLCIGGSIGFLSGMIGMGGGILLSPLLLLFRWADQKQTASVSALFIFVNSLSGLSGQLTKGIHFTAEMYGYIFLALTGGLLGAWAGARRFPQPILKNILATALLVAAGKLLFTH
jgi:uncharacterized membrane protein YfcA